MRSALHMWEEETSLKPPYNMSRINSDKFL